VSRKPEKLRSISRTKVRRMVEYCTCFVTTAQSSPTLSDRIWKSDSTTQKMKNLLASAWKPTKKYLR
jgi:hypothetical protein